MKLIQVLDRFEAGTLFTLSKFIDQRKLSIEQQLIAFIENDPGYVHSSDRATSLMPPNFDDVMMSEHSNVWQLIISSLAVAGADVFPLELINAFKKMALTYISDGGPVTFMITLLTMLAAMADSPLQLFKDTPGDENQDITNQIIDQMFNTAVTSIDSKPGGLRLMFMSIHISSFPICVDRLTNLDNHRIVALAMHAMAWNTNFPAISQHIDFITSFVEVFDRLTKWCFENKILSVKNQPLTPEETTAVNQNAHLLSDYIASCYRILFVNVHHYRKQYAAPMPIKMLVRENSGIPGMDILLIPLLNLMRLEFTGSLGSYLHYFVVKSLSLWLECHKITDMTILSNDEIIKLLETGTEIAPSILTNLLAKNFVEMYSKFLDHAEDPGGEKYFKAIYTYFNSPTLQIQADSAEILQQQWMACTPYTVDNEFGSIVQMVYETSGSIIFLCFRYMAQPGTELVSGAFILLMSLAPLMSLIHMKGRDDDIQGIMHAALDICEHNPQNLNNLTNQDVLEISQALSVPFQFCMEQMFNDAFDHLPKYPPQLIWPCLDAMIPWFQLVKFDVENRVISNETDLLFMHFSCFSFVDKLVSAFASIIKVDLSTTMFTIWRTLVTDDESANKFLCVILSLIYNTENVKNHSAVYPVMRFLYRIAGDAVADFLTAFLSFNRSFNPSQLLVGPEAPECDVLMGYEDDEDTEKNDVSDHHLICFVLDTLNKFAQESFLPLIPSLPRVFAYALIFFDTYQDLIYQLLLTILNEMVMIVNQDSVSLVHEAIRLVSSLAPSAKRKTIEDSEMVELSASITRVLIDFNENMAEEYGLVLLRWGLASSDLQHAAVALKCYEGNLLSSSYTLVGLMSRSLWHISEAAHFLQGDVEPYIHYIKAVLSVLLHISCNVFEENNMLSSDCSVFWIAMESLHLNGKNGDAFNEAMRLLDFYLSHTELFAGLASREQFNTAMFSPMTFWKFYKPWNDTFPGCAHLIFQCEGEHFDFDRTIRVLNLLLQCGYSQIIADKPNSQYAVLLSLLPWMWKVVTTDMARYIYDSPDVMLMEATYQSLETFIDPEVVPLFSFILSSEEIDIFSTMEEIVATLMPLIDTEDIVDVLHFYTTLVTKGQKVLRLPIYSICTWILHFSQDPTPIAQHLTKIIIVAQKDAKENRRAYKKMFLEAVPQGIEPAPDVEREVFPKLELYERIVAIGIPHLYEPTIDEMNGPSDSLNSVPPLIPQDPRLLGNPFFAELVDRLSKMKIEPFYTWNDLLSKLHMSLVDAERIGQMNRSTFAPFDTPAIFAKVMQSTDPNTLSTTMLDVMMEEEEEAQIEYVDPYSFISIDAQQFIPSVDDANIIGNDLFETPDLQLE